MAAPMSIAVNFPLTPEQHNTAVQTFVVKTMRQRNIKVARVTLNDDGTVTVSGESIVAAPKPRTPRKPKDAQAKKTK